MRMACPDMAEGMTRDILEFFSVAHDNRWIEFNSRSLPTGPTAPPGALSPPLWLLAELTYRCPLQCPYCSNPLEFAALKDELDTEQWVSVLRQARELGAAQLGLSGGEPLVRRDLEELVTEARQLGYYSNLITSGVGLTDERVRPCARPASITSRSASSPVTPGQRGVCPGRARPSSRSSPWRGGQGARLSHGAQLRAPSAQHRPDRGDPRPVGAACRRTTWSWPTCSTTAGPCTTAMR
jgi:hypothetical protein